MTTKRSRAWNKAYYQDETKHGIIKTIDSKPSGQIDERKFGRQNREEIDKRPAVLFPDCLKVPFHVLLPAFFFSLFRKSRIFECSKLIVRSESERGLNSMHRADMDAKQNRITKEKVKPAKKFYGEMIKGNSWWLMKWMNTEKNKCANKEEK